MQDSATTKMRLDELEGKVIELEDTLRQRDALHQFMQDFFLEHAIGEKRKRRKNDQSRLEQLRSTPRYQEAFTLNEPLVTVIVPTLNRAETILERALPSLQAQTYENWELVVVGDAMDAAQEQLLRQMPDSRARFFNLRHRGRYPQHKGPRWYAAGSKPANFGLKVARGMWIAHLDDDDELTPHHMSDLLNLARERHVEWVHGNVLFVSDDGYPAEVIGGAEPELGAISRISSLYHGCLKTFQYNPGAWKYLCPGDWDLWDRFLAMGVRHAHLPGIVGVHYGSRFGVMRAYGYEPAKSSAASETALPDAPAKAGTEVPDGETLYSEAERLLEHGDHAEAMAVLHRLLEVDPRHAMAHNDAGVLCFQQGEIQLAHKLLQRAHDLSPDSLLILRNLISVLSTLNEHGKALQLLTSFVKRNPGEHEARDMLHALKPVADEIAQVSVAPQDSPRWCGADAVDQGSEQRPGVRPAEPAAPVSAVVAALEVRKISSFEEFEQHCHDRHDHLAEIEQLESRLVLSQEAFRVPGYCYVCQKKSDFLVDFSHCGHRDGRPVPNWRERMVCPTCGLNNRLRASVHLFEQACGVKADDSIYITEQVSPLFKTLKQQYPNVVGSEYLGDVVALGSVDARGIRNESLTDLSFEDNSFDHIMTFDVLEHVPDYQRAVAECFRCLKPGGTLMFSVPFARSSRTNIVRAKLEADGSVEHLLPPEYHGDPVNPGDGCLCYYHFGWELLDELRELGFEDVTALYYWSADLGYLGGEQSVFFATKPLSQYQLKTAEL